MLSQPKPHHKNRTRPMIRDGGPATIDTPPQISHRVANVMARIGIIVLQHESNTFLENRTEWEHFEQDLLVRGTDIRADSAGEHHELAGFMAGLADQRMRAVPLIAARAVPGGVVSARAFARLVELTFDQLHRAGRLDGLLLAPHGALVAEDHPDGDGHWTAQLRDHVGGTMPIVATIDPHANLSPRMVAACDALLAYRTNPHLDQYDRGMDAAHLMARIMRDGVRPTTAATFPPLAINIERQSTSEPPLASVMQQADEMLQQHGMLSNSIVFGFPYADVPEMGSTAIVVTDNNETLAMKLAAELGNSLWSRRDAFLGELIGVDEAVRRATAMEGPVCLLDMGDNIGGGSPGDGTLLAHAIQRHAETTALVCLCDAATVEQAVDAGSGTTVMLEVGGKTDHRHGRPLCDVFRVERICSGRFVEPQSRHGGASRFDQGRSVVLRGSRGLTLLVTSRRVPPFSLRQLTSCQLDPADFQMLVAKGVHAPTAAYATACRHFLRVNTAGCTSADLQTFPYHRVRRPLFPLDRDVSWDATA